MTLFRGPPMIGERLSHYRILEKLGAGGMGEVYRAHDEQLDRDVAIKVLPPSSVEDVTARARLLREAKAAAALNHPAICTIHEVGEDQGRVYFAMELVEGRPLSELVHRGPLAIDDTLRYGAQIADALAHAHARHIVHRDLKCGNVVVTADGRAKVLDFGLAKRLEEPAPVDATTVAGVGVPLTAAGMMTGTFAYMAPEQLRGATATMRSDLWSLGIVLFEMCSGRRPFTGHSLPELCANIIGQPPAPLPAVVPAAVRAVVERCLQKDPARRYQQASEVSAAFEAIRAGTDRPASAGVHAARPRWRVAGVGALAVAGLVAALVVYGTRPASFGGGSRIDSLAVLPLANLSGDPEQDYFADGLTEVLSTDLARLGGLRRVISRGSVIRYKDTTRPLGEIARELNVDALVTGSVLLSGERVSITAQLLDPATGDQLWTNRYERNLRDVLVLRNEIVAAIVGEIGLQLSAPQQAQLSAAPSVNAAAFEAYLRGRFEWLKQTREGFDTAEKYYQLAVDRDPSSSLGYAGLASVWFMRGDAGIQPPGETFPKADAFMTRALQLGDDSAELHLAAGNHRLIEWDWDGAEQAYARALAVNPSFADAHFFNADLMATLKRPAEWQAGMDRARELDPLNEFHRTYYGWHLNYAHRYAEAIDVFQALLPTAPNKAASYLGLWGAYLRTGRYGEARAAARDYFVAAGDREFAELMGSGGDAAGYRAAMRGAGQVMAERSTTRHVPAIRIARMYAHAGDVDEAIRWLEVAYTNHESPLGRLGVFWDWDDLRGDPRFQDLQRRLKLP
jgi:TolB-like protein